MAGGENGESGALSPLEATQETYETGLHHLNKPSQLVFVKNAYGGSLLSLGGMPALTASAETPGLQELNPGIPRVLQGPLSNWTSYHLFRRSRAVCITPILVLHSAL